MSAHLFKYQKIIFFILTVIAAVFVLFPAHNFQAPLAQGDHGKELYAFQRTAQGDIPYRDYSWNYGLLSPYYYGAIFKVFGESVQNVLAAEMAVKVVGVVFFYLALAQFFSPLFSFTAALWFCKFQMGFNYTYNHSLGVTALLLLAFFVLSYIRSPKVSKVNGAFCAVLALSFVKINFGFVMLFIMAVVFPILDKIKPSSQPHRSAYIVKPVAALIFIAVIYRLFTWGLPEYALRQSFPLFQGVQSHTSAITMFFNLFKNIRDLVMQSWSSIVLVILFLLSCLYFFVRTPQLDEKKSLRNDVFLAAGIALILAAGSLHELFLGGMAHRIAWAQPFQLLLFFLVIGWLLYDVPKFIRWFFCFSFFLIVAVESFYVYRSIDIFCRNDHSHFRVNKTDVCVTNPFDWHLVVHETVKYLNEHLDSQEVFFALPHDALYYFLTEKKSPVRELFLFNEVKIAPVQEARIIQDLERKGVRYVVLSNRCAVAWDQLGTFGETYCPMLARYILSNFEAVYKVGDWAQEPGWVSHHRVMIMKRISK